MTLSGTAIAGAILAIAVVAAAWLIGLERVWSWFGPADLGPVSFETLERRSSPNDALACPSGLCRAQSDLTPPIYAASVKTLKAAMARVIATERDVVRVNEAGFSERYVQRSRWLRFPDTIVVRYIARGDTEATLALYSRSQLGKGDLGVNKSRIERWLRKLSAEVPIAQR